MVFANSSFIVFMVLISCWHEIQVGPHLFSLLWSKKVVFPLFLVKNLLLRRRSQWQGCLSYVVSVHPQIVWDAPGLCHHSKAEWGWEVQLTQHGPDQPHHCSLLEGLGNTNHTPHTVFRRPPVNPINQTLQSDVPFAHAVQHKSSVFSTISITVTVMMRDGLVWGRQELWLTQ